MTRLYHQEISNLLKRDSNPDFKRVAHRKLVPSDCDFPYPVIHLIDGLDLHIVPMYNQNRFWVVERETDEILSRALGPPCCWMKPGEREDLVERLGYGISGQRQPTGFVDELRNTFLTDLAKEFDDKLAERLRRPTLHALISQSDRPTTGLQEYQNQYGESSKTNWQISIKSGHYSELHTTYTTKQICSRSAKRFNQEYRKNQRHYSGLCNASWFQLSSYWIKTAEILQFSDSDRCEQRPSEFEFVRSPNRLLHLKHNGSQETECSHIIDSVELVPFSLENLPIAHQICNYCSPRINEIRISERIRDQ